LRRRADFVCARKSVYRRRRRDGERFSNKQTSLNPRHGCVERVTERKYRSKNGTLLIPITRYPIDALIRPGGTARIRDRTNYAAYDGEIARVYSRLTHRLSITRALKDDDDDVTPRGRFAGPNSWRDKFRLRGKHEQRVEINRTRERTVANKKPRPSPCPINEMAFNSIENPAVSILVP